MEKYLDYTNANGFYPTICIELLNWCNLNCKVCRSNSSKKMTDILDYEKVVNLLQKLNKYGNWRISLTGGEPLYYPDISKILNYLFTHNFQFSVTTNGYKSIDIFNTIDQQVWELGTLYTSIDGLTSMNDLIRGRGSYENTVKFIQHVRPIVPRLNVSTVLHFEPGPWVQEMYNILTELNVNNWTLISPIYEGRYKFKYYNEKIYSKWASEIRCVQKGKTTISFLDFASKHNQVQEVVFINPKGNVKLLGFTNSEGKPTINNTNIDNAEIAELIFKSISNFYKSEQYIF